MYSTTRLVSCPPKANDWREKYIVKIQPNQQQIIRQEKLAGTSLQIMSTFINISRSSSGFIPANFSLLASSKSISDTSVFVSI